MLLLHQTLSPSDDQNSPALEEGELQQSEIQKGYGDVNLGSQEQSEPVIIETTSADTIMQDPLNSLVGVASFPSYAEILKKKSTESSGSSEEDDNFTKKGGRKSQKEIQEEEAERLNM